jgi:hypothetical protein
MKRIISIGIVTLVLLSTVIFLLSYINADYHGRIGELSKDKFSVFPEKIDPEADYVLPIIYFNDDTKVVEKVNHVSELKNGQKIMIWSEDSEGIILANKIKVIELSK